MNNNLIGIVIDSGHGGTDSGAVGNNMYEKDFGSAGVQQRRVEVQHGCGCDQGSGICHRHYWKSHLLYGNETMGRE